MQYVFLIRSRAGCKKYVTLLAAPRDVTRLRLVTYFLHPALERIKNTYCVGKRPFAVSVCLSVCVSVTFVNYVKTNKYIFKIFSPSGNEAILVFPYQTS